MKFDWRHLKQRAKSFARHHPYLVASLAGYVYFLISLSWIKSVRTAELVSNPWLAQAISASAYLITAAVFAVSWPISVWLFRQLKLKFTSLHVIWLLPAIWLITDCFRSVMFSIISYGPGSRIGDYWNFGSLGMWLINTPFVYAARLGGLYLLTAIVIALISAIIFGIQTKRWLSLLFVVSLTCLLSLLGWAIYKNPSGPKINIAAVSLQAGQSPYQDSQTIASLLNNQPSQTIDALFLPEYSQFWVSDPTRDSQAAQHILKSSDSIVIHSVSDRNFDTVTNNEQFVGPNGSVLFSQSKWFIIPGGENTPYFYQFILRITGQQQLIKTFESTHSIAPSKNIEAPFLHNNISYGALACSAVNVPVLYRNLAVQGASILSNSAALSTLGLSSQYHLQSRNQAKLIAISNARPFIQSARGGLSFIIDSNGQIMSSTSQLTSEIVSAEVQVNTQQTIYTIFGNWILLVALGLIVMKYYNAEKDK